MPLKDFGKHVMFFLGILIGVLASAAFLAIVIFKFWESLQQ
jgi:hypothetical protein